MCGAAVMRIDMPLTRQKAASEVSPSSSRKERHNPASGDLDASDISARDIREYPRRRKWRPARLYSRHRAQGPEGSSVSTHLIYRESVASVGSLGSVGDLSDGVRGSTTPSRSSLACM
jgi:hypothetical protein